MKNIAVLLASLILSLTSLASYKPLPYTDEEKLNLVQFKKMHEDVIEGHHTEHMDSFYHPSFELFSNKQHFNYGEYKQIYSNLHKNIYKHTKVHYKRIFAKDNKVSAYMDMDIEKSDGNKKHIESMIIAEMDHGKIKKIYEISLAR